MDRRMRSKSFASGALLAATAYLAGCGSSSGSGGPTPTNLVTLGSQSLSFTPCTAVLSGSDLHFTAWQTDAPYVNDPNAVQGQTVFLSLGVHFPGTPAPGSFSLEPKSLAAGGHLCITNSLPYCTDQAEGDKNCPTPAESGPGAYCNGASGWCVTGTSTVTYFSVATQSVDATAGAIQIDSVGAAGGLVTGSMKGSLTLNGTDTALKWTFAVPIGN